VVKVVVLISGGIDSPVAAYVLANGGADVTLLHMDNRPYSGPGSVDKVVRLADQLEVVLGHPLPLWTAPTVPASSASPRRASATCSACCASVRKWSGIWL
jgi:thiamine biosynthesis protein ThiI